MHHRYIPGEEIICFIEKAPTILSRITSLFYHLFKQNFPYPDNTFNIFFHLFACPFYNSDFKLMASAHWHICQGNSLSQYLSSSLKAFIMVGYEHLVQGKHSEKVTINVKQISLYFQFKIYCIYC